MQDAKYSSYVTCPQTFISHKQTSSRQATVVLDWPTFHRHDLNISLMPHVCWEDISVVTITVDRQSNCCQRSFSTRRKKNNWGNFEAELLFHIRNLNLHPDKSVQLQHHCEGRQFSVPHVHCVWEMPAAQENINTWRTYKSAREVFS